MNSTSSIQRVTKYPVTHRRCPISRKIKTCKPGETLEDGDHVPPYYRDQMLLLMEVLDLEKAYYMEWRPENFWEPEEMGVTIVRRDRDWFERSLPKLREFWEEMTELRAYPKDELLKMFPPPRRPTRVIPTRTPPVFGYRFVYRPPITEPSGGPDEFFALPEVPLLEEEEDALAESEIYIERQPDDDEDLVPED